MALNTVMRVGDKIDLTGGITLYVELSTANKLILEIEAPKSVKITKTPRNNAQNDENRGNK